MFATLLEIITALQLGTLIAWQFSTGGWAISVEVHFRTVVVGKNNLSQGIMKRNIYIHGLRGFLATSLFFYHVVQSKLPSFQNPFADSITYMANSLEYGVELFFGISGIVIIFAFQKNRSPFRFLLDRSIRIFPVLWLTIAIIFSLSQLDARRAIPFDALNVTYNVLALNVLFPTKLIHPSAWSIGYEFTFYGILAIFSIIISRAHRGIALLFAVLCAVFLIAHNIRALPFIIGIAIAFHSMKCEVSTKDKLALFPSGFFIFLSLLFWHNAYSIMPSRSGMDFLNNHKALLFYVAATISAALGLFGVYQGRGTFSKILTTPLFQWLGTISFSFYLWQTVVMALVKAAMLKGGVAAAVGVWSQLVFALLALPPTLVVSHLSQIYIESKFSTWLHRKTSGNAATPPKTANAA